MRWLAIASRRNLAGPTGVEAAGYTRVSYVLVDNHLSRTSTSSRATSRVLADTLEAYPSDCALVTV